jgi:SAM-dependent methyltransferase
MSESTARTPAPSAAPVLPGGACCPTCRGRLTSSDARLVCSGCGADFGLQHGIWVLIGSDSLFHGRALPDGRGRNVGARVGRLLPSLVGNVSSRSNYERLLGLLGAGAGGRRPRVLVVGGQVAGQGSESLYVAADIDLVETDVGVGPRTQLACDAHQLPFVDGSFDAVVIQAVLPAVPAPGRCVAEIHRVLRPGGLVYSEDSFMQPVWAGASDFTRFAPSGHRLLFAAFDRVDSGVACGPGSALAGSWEYFLIAFARSRGARRLMRVAARLTAFWLKWFDRWLITRPAALDAASSLYFLGRRSDRVIDDAEAMSQYAGAVRSLS